MALKGARAWVALSGYAPHIMLTRRISVENPTKHKIREAEHFLCMMKQSFEDDDKFTFNFSAFVSAARSITFYLKKQYTRRKGFSEWYSPIVKKMREDPELTYLKKVRNEDIHKETVQTGATRTVSIGISVVFGEPSPKSEQAKETEKPPKQISPKTIRRFFPKFGDMCIIEFCEKQLDKLNKIVEECEKQFLARNL